MARNTVASVPGQPRLSHFSTVCVETLASRAVRDVGNTSEEASVAAIAQACLSTKSARLKEKWTLVERNRTSAHILGNTPGNTTRNTTRNTNFFVREAFELCQTRPPQYPQALNAHPIHMHNFVREPICENIRINAPIERCFSLSTRVELVRRTIGMRVIGGVATGNIAANDRVVWRGWKFGFLTEHHTLITAFEPPHSAEGQRIAFFDDSQERGRFATFRHEHLFRQSGDATELEDRIHFSLPFGALGRLVATFLVAPHIRKLARRRFALIKRLAEGDGWREWIAEPST